MRVGWQISQRTVWIGASIILGFALLVYISYAINLIQFPFDYDQGEGFELVDTMMFSQFQMPYQDTEVYPFYSSNYPPLFHIIPVPFVWAFGGAYWYIRLLAFIGTLICASLIAYAVHREGQHRWIAILAGLAFLSSNFVYHIGPLVRQHATMVLFETASVVILAYSFNQREKWGIVWGLFFLICAGYTKQLAAISAVAILLWMFLQNPRRAILWGFGFAFVGGAIFAWLTIATNGEWWRQAIVANVNEFTYIQMRGLFELWFKLHGFLIIPAVLMVLYQIYFERISLYAVWFVVATVLGGVGAGTWGAGDSYYTTSIAGMCILSGIFFSRLINNDLPLKSHYLGRILRIIPSKPIVTASLIVVPLIYSLYGVATFKMPTYGVFEPIADVLNVQPNVHPQFFDSATYNVLGYARIGYHLTQADIDAGYRIVDIINSSEQPAISEDAGFSIVAGRDVVTNPTQLLNLSRAGMFEGDEILRMIAEQEFSVIILRAQFYPESVLIAMTTYYEEQETILMNGFDYKILYPREVPLGTDS